MRRVMLIALALVASLGITASTATTANHGDRRHRRVRSRSAARSRFPARRRSTRRSRSAMKAYFSYINARRGPDGKRGVYGRQIIWNYNDDQYTPPNTVQLTRGLVEQDKVFAVVGSLGTEVNLAIRPYLNRRRCRRCSSRPARRRGARTGSSTRGRPAGSPPTSSRASSTGRRSPRNSPNAKIGVLYQNDDYGKDYITGLKAGLGAKASNIVDEEPFEVDRAERYVADREAARRAARRSS